MKVLLCICLSLSILLTAYAFGEECERHPIDGKQNFVVVTSSKDLYWDHSLSADDALKQIECFCAGDEELVQGSCDRDGEDWKVFSSNWSFVDGKFGHLCIYQIDQDSKTILSNRNVYRAKVKLRLLCKDSE